MTAEVALDKRSRIPHETEAGQAHPLGARVGPEGTNFSVFAQDAHRVELLLFDSENPRHLVQTVELDPKANKSFHFWHAHVPRIGGGTPYAFRVHGPKKPRPGQAFDGAKVLLDPYARAVWDEAFDRGAACRPGDNLDRSLRGIVVDTASYDWEGDLPLCHPMNETLIYEMHVGGFTKSPTSHVAHPGTFLGVIEKIPYLVDLGITAVELLPIFAFDHRELLRPYPQHRPPLVNYWGYDPYAHFALHPGYGVPGELTNVVNQFRDMVKALHRAGIEVIVDVVFNHTSEGNRQGPILSLKGFANDVYYMINSKDPDWDYVDYSGCGNTLNVNHPITTQLIMDCLGYWTKEMHVDGFRFDEASVLSRGDDGAPLHYPPAVWQIEMAEVTSSCKLIAEAWDAGGLYQVGRFPDRWAQWNGPFRDDVRRFVRGDPGMVGTLATRLAGSADIFEPIGERPGNVINFITAHDGFTLRDLVSYNYKHNEANGEDNHDGLDDNTSWNCGTEGPTADARVTQLRDRQVKNLAVVLLLSQGTPMIIAGDEFGRTQHGNNNAYCQDNELAWIDWTLLERNSDLYRFFQKLIKFRHAHRPLRRREYSNAGADTRDLPAFSWHGCRLNDPGWNDPEARALACTVAAPDEGDSDLHLIFNACWKELDFELPELSGRSWRIVIDTAQCYARYGIVDTEDAEPIYAATVRAAPRSCVVLVSLREGDQT
jgi:glycogen operon protein